VYLETQLLMSDSHQVPTTGWKGQQKQSVPKGQCSTGHQHVWTRIVDLMSIPNCIFTPFTV